MSTGTGCISMMILLLFAFLSGIVTILSPCILPVLPIVLSGSVGGKRRPIGVILGFVASFSIFTLALSTLVRVLNIPPETLRVVAVVLIISFGLVMLIPSFRTAFELVTSRLTSRGQKKNPSAGFTGGLLTGLSLGLVWTPCVGPIIASVISLAITRSVDGGAVFIILAYSIGTSIPMFAIMMGGRSFIKRFPALSKNPIKIQQVFGVLMILVGISIATGMDRRFQSAVLNIFPNYGSGLTAFENIEPVQKAINSRSNDAPGLMMAGETEVSFDVPPKNGKLGDYGPAPELISTGQWFNTGIIDNQGQTISMDNLRGKVVLLDFWTYSCVNCVRTIPHLKALYDAYGGENFVIIGVHTPEFVFERNPDNVRRAMSEMGINWPVVLDNEFEQWKAYNNRYWPAHYFIDAEGRIRYFHFGEGEYDTAEDVVRALLKEAGTLTTRGIEKKEEVRIESRTPEIYLGFSRTKGFFSKENIKVNQAAQYIPAGRPGNGEWNLQGLWTFKPEYIVPGEDGTLELGFDAKNVFLVIEPQDNNGWIEVQIDGNKSQNTSDVQNGILTADESRLYELVVLPKTGKHILTLKVHGELRLFAFTFG
jgi:cytochrome c biogenesis protein CcdA/thiol-disulfide isomerase/thioredoxin